MWPSVIVDVTDNALQGLEDADIKKGHESSPGSFCSIADLKLPAPLPNGLFACGDESVQNW